LRIAVVWPNGQVAPVVQILKQENVVLYKLIKCFKNWHALNEYQRLGFEPLALV
jgi:hypothetical protein